ncbi:hypothetical protein R1flu_028567 [Riccia fluitans]|uniref:S-protein homolog n=1 Tax=Riccia fluitans TaxID=41844 RepID=A0ABD1XM25_9MARC
MERCTTLAAVLITLHLCSFELVFSGQGQDDWSTTTVDVVIQSAVNVHDVVAVGCIGFPDGRKVDAILSRADKLELDFQVAEFTFASIFCNFHMYGAADHLSRYAYNVSVWLGSLVPGHLCDDGHVQYRCTDYCSWEVYRDAIYVRQDGTDYKCREWHK